VDCWGPSYNLLAPLHFRHRYGHKHRLTMNSPALVRRLLSPAPTRVLSRSYATPVNRAEPDPQLNGYPELPNVSRQYLPPYGWWDQQMRRNFGDTVSLSRHRPSVFLSVWSDGPIVA
jgi:hypothetical protein